MLVSAILGIKGSESLKEDASSFNDSDPLIAALRTTIGC
jgi:hypothetical protein